MRNGLKLGLIIVTAVFLAGCTSPDENPDWNPREEFPAWAYDAPFYYQPAEELVPQETVGNNIPIYYVRNQLVFIRHPELPADWRTTPPESYKGKDMPEGKDRANFIKDLWKYALTGHIELWFSPDAGQHWARAGYFGQEQSHYLFDSGGDGNYWIRFVGAGQKPSKVPPGQPHEIVVVDTKAPQIEITISPSPWEDEDKKIPHYYTIGETVTVSWSVSDMCLAPDSIKLSTAYAYFPHNLVWSEYDKPLQPCSSMPVKIPAEAADQSGMKFRIVAKDKAGNIGLGMSDVMYVKPDKPAEPTTPEEPVAPPIAEITLLEAAIVSNPASQGEQISREEKTQLVPPAGLLQQADTPQLADNNTYFILEEAIEPVAPVAEPVISKAYFEIEPEQVDTPAPAAVQPVPVEAEIIAVEQAPEPAVDVIEPVAAVVEKPTETQKVVSPQDTATDTAEVALAESLFELYTEVTPVKTPVKASQSPEEIVRDADNSEQCDIPEAIQLGWPSRGMTLRSGVSRLLSWTPQAATGYKTLELQFSSSDGKKWITVANRIKPGQALTWTVPVVSSKNCRLRIVGLSDKGEKKVLVTSQGFVVDTGVWETIDLSGCKSSASDKNRS